MDRYRHWEQRLILLRTRTGGEYSHEEVPIVEAMTAAWEDLTEAEQALLDQEGPQAPNRMANEMAAGGNGDAWRPVRIEFNPERVPSYRLQMVTSWQRSWRSFISAESDEKAREEVCI